MGGLSSVHNIREEVSVVTSIAQTSTGGTITGASVDRLSYGDCQSAVVHHAIMKGGGAAAPTSVQVVSILIDSDDNTTFTSSAAQPSLANLANNGGTSAEASAGVDLAPAKRYIAVQSVVTLTGGTTPFVPVLADLVLGGQSEQPAT